MASELGAALPGYMNGLIDEEKGGNSGNAGDIASECHALFRAFSRENADYAGERARVGEYCLALVVAT